MGVVVHFHVRSNTINAPKPLCRFHFNDHHGACLFDDGTRDDDHSAADHLHDLVRRALINDDYKRPVHNATGGNVDAPSTAIRPVCANDRCRLPVYHDGPCDDSAADSA